MEWLVNVVQSFQALQNAISANQNQKPKLISTAL